MADICKTRSPHRDEKTHQLELKAGMASNKSSLLLSGLLKAKRALILIILK